MTTGRRVSEVGRAKLQRAGLDAIARVSGGYAALRDETLPSAITRVLSELDHYYVLGFEPTDPKNPKARAVDVRVNRPGLLVQHRTAYQLDETARLRAVAAYKKDPLLGLAYSPIPTSDLPLRLWASVLPPAIGVCARADRAVARQRQRRRSRSTRSSSSTWTSTRRWGSPVGRKLTGIPPSPLPLEAPALRPGRYQLRVSARDDTAGGSVYMTVTVPEFANMALAVTGLVLGEDFSSRPDTGPLPFAPTLNRVFGPGSTLRVGFKVWRPAPGDVETAIEIRDANGKTSIG